MKLDEYMWRDILKSSQPFEEYLKWVHADDYHGTDDDMPDAFDAFVGGLENQEQFDYANDFALALIKRLTK